MSWLDGGIVCCESNGLPGWLMAVRQTEQWEYWCVCVCGHAFGTFVRCCYFFFTLFVVVAFYAVYGGTCVLSRVHVCVSECAIAGPHCCCCCRCWLLLIYNFLTLDRASERPTGCGFICKFCFYFFSTFSLAFLLLLLLSSIKLFCCLK